MNPFAFLWNHLNPITVRELRRCNRPRGLMAVLAVLYVLGLPSYAAAMIAFPPLRLYQAEISMFVIGLGFVWAGIGALATVSAASRMMTLPSDDPLLKLTGMNARQQVNGYFLTLAIYAAAAAFMPIPYILAAVGLDLAFSAAPDQVEMLPYFLLILLYIFLGTNATTAYFFSFFARTDSGTQRFFASFFAIFSPILYYMPYAFLGFFVERYLGGPFMDNGIVVWGFYAFTFAAMFTTAYLLSLHHFRRPFEHFAWAIFLNVLVYTALHGLFFFTLIAYAFSQSPFYN